ncbi:MAG TPA: NAD(P)H-binding protein [Terriglobales bacterium]|nr:NAD(P)H-binding protein [Terriglobales bacterium]
MPDVTHSVLVAGAPGYMGRRLIPVMMNRGHDVRALVRPGSEHKLSSQCQTVMGDPLRRETYADRIAPADTWVHLVGVPHPGPSKAADFRAIDLKSVEEAVPSAVKAGIGHLVYVSVAHPAPVMKAYIEVRQQCEQIIRDSGLRATILRPWYVLGEGHRWPVVLKPAYWLLENCPARVMPLAVSGWSRSDGAGAGRGGSSRAAPDCFRRRDPKNLVSAGFRKTPGPSTRTGVVVPRPRLGSHDGI